MAQCAHCGDKQASHRLELHTSSTSSLVPLQRFTCRAVGSTKAERFNGSTFHVTERCNFPSLSLNLWCKPFPDSPCLLCSSRLAKISPLFGRRLTLSVT